jgi:hypothetical protein
VPPPPPGKIVFTSERDGNAEIYVMDSNGTNVTRLTDNPAFDPWWTGGSKSKDWEINDPRTGKGYESAVAYGIAKRLGFTKRRSREACRS